MTEKDESKSNFAGTYYTLDKVLRITKGLKIASWVIAGFYGYQLAVGLTVFILQVSRHLIYIGGPTDFLQQISWVFQSSMAGLIFFISLQAIAEGLLILLDIEDNTRRAARK